MIPVLASVLLSSAALDAPISVGNVLCHPRRLLVKSLPTDNAEAFSGLKVKAVYSEIGWTVVEVPQGKLFQSKAELERLSTVERVEFDLARKPAYDPNDPLWPDMWHMTAMNANTAWDLSFGGGSAIVAVIDTGVEFNHPDLSFNGWINIDELPGNNVDDDHNGYVDDIVGYDFAYSDPNPDDVYGHGTACAGLVAATQDNNLGGTGVAPRARIMPLKAAIDSGYFYASADVGAFLYAANNGANVLSMSFYGDGVSAAEGDAIRYCWQNGVLPVAAAGNDSTTFTHYPGGYDETLSVAAYGTNLSKASFSNFGLWVDVVAPGVSLRTTATGGGFTSGFSGTSGACPHVAGLAALLIGANPLATAQEVRNAIEDTATPVNQASIGVYANYGRINARLAMEAILGTPAPARAPELRAVSALGSQFQDVFYDSEEFLTGRLIGRGFADLPNLTLNAVQGTTITSLPILSVKRDYIDFEYPAPVFGTLELRTNGNLIGTSPMPTTYRICYPMTEANTLSATLTGGYAQTIVQDTSNMTVTRRNDGTHIVQASFRRVKPSQDMKLVIRRRYTGTVTGTEVIKLYQWSTASYPYGSFVELRNGSTPLTMTTETLTIPTPSNFVDFEGTMYLVIESDNTGSGSQLQVDMMHITSDK